jgi:hypothetical protein
LCGVSKSGTARLSQRVREGMGGDSTYFNTDSLSGKCTETARTFKGKMENKLICEKGVCYEECDDYITPEDIHYIPLK